MNESWLPPDPTGNRLGHVLDEEYDCDLHGGWGFDDGYEPPFDHMNDDPFEGSRESDEYPND